ncbi:MAG: radical SAM family heme chaperone HemW [Clostridiales bacterium]|nr:radical SAM family heme chaperone HemW [Clostridiales bacterium]
MKGIYIHIPYCAKRCVYCAFVSGAPHDSMPLYVQALKDEMDERLIRGDDISTIYIGGGTPSVLYRGAINDILSFVRGRCNVRADAEITVECNPDSVTHEFVDEIVGAGVNRVSIGLQTDNDELLKRINRPHNLNGFLKAWELLSPIKNKSLDLMIGLPGQTEEDLYSSIELAVKLGAPHISLYALKSEEGTLLYNSGFVEDEDFEALLYEKAYKYLTDHGYNRYEVSNFCLGDNYSRHNFAYWDLVDYYGFGVSAHSLLDGKRIANDDNINKYILRDSIRTEVDVTADRADEYIMLALRTSKGIDLNRLKGYGVDLLECKQKEIAEFIKNGYLTIDDNCLKLTEDAYFVMNSIISSLI